ncbi:hypothetical protein GC087_02510 [Pantoea sp. JZ2]|uniref:hypothetical protein n=1 Tax=Pantoea sp. JZ2 TaxID=2654189 RepID=UPI002B459F33|nr:hypothetical protein [Pantoea sp. JZ2]WRH11575.1 hypothetical protein GC087_02510 [Pantoea sp. JZ2]
MQDEIAKALAVALKRDGHELDGADRLLIRKTISEGLASQRRKDNHLRSANGHFAWARTPNPRSK